jgi:ABC-type nitrate/sulfonate/bicarbonate transport system substrate-binding protein
MAYEKKLLTKRGINVNPVYIAGGSRAVQALIAKDADVAIVWGGRHRGKFGGSGSGCSPSNVGIFILHPFENSAD